MRLSELQSKNIVNIVDGKNIGTIIDVIVMMDGRVEALVIEGNRNFFSLNRSNLDTKIKWGDIKKIGEDVILVEIGSR